MMKFYSSRSLLNQESGKQSYGKLLKKLMAFALIMCISTTVFAQKTVKRQVTENGLGLPGVSVSVKGTYPANERHEFDV